MPESSNEKASEIKESITKVEEENEQARGLDLGNKDDPNGNSEYSLETEWARGNSFTLYDQKSRFDEAYMNNLILLLLIDLAVELLMVKLSNYLRLKHLKIFPACMVMHYRLRV